MLLCERFTGFIRVTAVFFSIIMINVPDDVFVRDKNQFIVLSKFNVPPYGELFDYFYQLMCL